MKKLSHFYQVVDWARVRNYAYRGFPRPTLHQTFMNDRLYRVSSDPSYEFMVIPSVLDEGDVLTCTVKTTNLVNNTILYYTITGTGVSASDFVDNSVSGSFLIQNNKGYIAKQIKQDLCLEGTEHLKLTLRKDSITGEVLLDSANITINDTSTSPRGEVVFITPGTTYWTVPENVTSVCVVCIGGGGASRFSSTINGTPGGGGGGLGWRNYIPVIPGESVTVIVGAGGVGNIYGVLPTAGGYSAALTVTAFGGAACTSSTTSNNDANRAAGGGYTTNGFPNHGGGSGGYGGHNTSTGNGGGGGGAGGYSGNGGNGNKYLNPVLGDPASFGTGGAAGGGGKEGGGGGVGLYGEGASGSSWVVGYGGSDGTNGHSGTVLGAPNGAAGSPGGLYGGGAAGKKKDTVSGVGGNGGNGAVRIIWGAGRAFPSTDVAYS